MDNYPWSSGIVYLTPDGSVRQYDMCSYGWLQLTGKNYDCTPLLLRERLCISNDIRVYAVVMMQSGAA